MTLYLTDRTPPEEVRRARASGFVVGAKLYPAGATTHSDAGVTSIDNVWGTLEALAEAGMVLQVHGEVTNPDVDVFDREREFIDRVLSRIAGDFESGITNHAMARANGDHYSRFTA